MQPNMVLLVNEVTEYVVYLSENAYGKDRLMLANVSWDTYEPLGFILPPTSTLLFLRPEEKARYLILPWLVLGEGWSTQDSRTKETSSSSNRLNRLPRYWVPLDTLLYNFTHLLVSLGKNAVSYADGHCTSFWGAGASCSPPA